MNWYLQKPLICYIYRSIFLSRYIPESNRWLHVNGKVDEVYKILRNIARINGKEFPEFKLVVLSQDSSAGLQHYKHLFKPATIAVKSLIQGYAWHVSICIHTHHYKISVRTLVNIYFQGDCIVVTDLLHFKFISHYPCKRQQYFCISFDKMLFWTLTPRCKLGDTRTHIFKVRNPFR